jgi:iron complex transport system substrate-binding protein
MVRFYRSIAKNFGKRCISLFLIGLLTTLLVSACGSRVKQNSPASSTASKCERAIEHTMGKTCLPKNPQRIITLDNFSVDTVLALGVKPVGSVKPFTSYLGEKLEGVRIIGTPQQPSLEFILALKPDLILGFSWYHEQIYQQLSEIAPTVIVDYNDGNDTKKIIKLIGAALGKPDAAQGIIDRYYDRLNQFKTKMGERLKNTEVSVIRIQANNFGLLQRGSFPGVILEAAGLPRPQKQQYLQPSDGNWNHIQINISNERIPDMDGDVLFVVASEEASTEQRLNQLKTDPLWSRLNVVKQGRVYEVPGYWLVGGPIALNKIVDDLFKYLIEQPNLT